MSEGKAAEQWCYNCHQGYGADYIVLCPPHAANRELLAAAKAALKVICTVTPYDNSEVKSQVTAAITKCEKGE